MLGFFGAGFLGADFFFDADLGGVGFALVDFAVISHSTKPGAAATIYGFASVSRATLGAG